MAGRASSRPSTPATPQQPERVKIPTWDLDPIGSLRPWPLVLHLGPQEVQLEPMSATDWLAILMSEGMEYHDLLDLIPGFDDYLLDSDMEPEEMRQLVQDMITTASSRKWWITLRLLGVALKHWDTIGPIMITKLDPDKVSLAAWMSVLQMTLIEGMEPKNAKMFIAQVQAPPPGEDATPQGVKELTAREFLAMSG